MASVFELEAMIKCRDAIVAKVFDLTAGEPAGKEYLRAAAEADKLIATINSEVEPGG